MAKRYDLVSLGEMMLRLEPPKYQRLRQTDSLKVRACGAQFNIAANMAALGGRSALLTKLPSHELGSLARSLAQGFGVDMSHVISVPDSKIGMVFVEFGVEPRRHGHIYDRAGSAASTITADDFSWQDILSETHYAYADGIFPGLNQGCLEATIEFVGAAKAAGCTVCFDMNYRQTIWQPHEALTLYQEVLPQVDILVTNRSVSEDVLDFTGDDEQLMRCYQDAYGNEIVCMTYRTMDGQLRGGWRSVALQEDQIVQGRAFSFDIVDRFGTGDAFFAGMLFAYQQRADLQTALDFGNALCAMAHTIDGDVATFSPSETEALLRTDYNLITKR